MFSNDERQMRFRKLEALKKFANEIYIKSSLSMNPSRFGKGLTLKKYIDDIVKLPSKWTENDYEDAIKKLNEVNLEYYENEHLMNNDLADNHDVINSNNPIKKLDEFKTIKFKSSQLVEFIVNLFRIAEIKDADAVCILMELMRNYGRRLVFNKEISNNYSNAFAISFIGPQYDKPDWIYKKIAEYLKTQNNNFDIKVTTKIC